MYFAITHGNELIRVVEVDTLEAAEKIRDKLELQCTDLEDADDLLDLRKSDRAEYKRFSREAAGFALGPKLK
jgi:hypothetical protein